MSAAPRVLRSAEVVRQARADEIFVEQATRNDGESFTVYLVSSFDGRETWDLGGRTYSSVKEALALAAELIADRAAHEREMASIWTEVDRTDFVRADGWRVICIGRSRRPWSPNAPSRPFAPTGTQLHRQAVAEADIRETMGGPFGSAAAAMARVDKILPWPSHPSQKRGPSRVKGIR